ncbi:CRISPR-associated endonuclease Cas2 [Patescibacteria group bacterium]|nr:MAG: CRISPR-associated endonuclease Cas2 [Patescibacteria group bacterium]
MRIHVSQNQKEVLKDLLIAGGVLAFVAIAPVAVPILKPLLKTKSPKRKTINYRRLLASLERQGFIQIEQDTITLTQHGSGFTQILTAVDTYVPPNKWDNKWRIVCFDMPEDYAQARRFLRDNLTKIGFFHLQKSVYVYPYNCLDIVQRVVDHFAIGRFVSFGTLESLENSSQLKLHFDL